MNEFKITEIIDANTLRVSPNYEIERGGNTFHGDKIKMRGMDMAANTDIVIERLKKLLLSSPLSLSFDAPELINYSKEKDVMVSCTVYLGQSDITNYFPEFVSKYR